MKLNKIVPALILSIVFLQLRVQVCAQATNKIDTVGNVGIGTTSPAMKLEVYGTPTSGVTTNAFLTNRNSTPSVWAGTTLGFGYQADLENYSSRIIGYSNAYNTYATRMQLQTHSSTSGAWNTGVLLDESGNVGIGTTTPRSTLQLTRPSGADTRIDFLQSGFTEYSIGINASIDALTFKGGNENSEKMRISETGNLGIGTTSPVSKLSISNNGAEGIEIDPVTGTNGGTDIISYNRSTSAYKQLTAKAYSFAFGTSAEDNSLVIINGGNVGIGTAAPSEKFSVNGNISTKKLIVTQTGWSDYVFNKGYKLRTLQQVETFINENKHLPELPSAKEVEEKGVSVGDNQALLLKKIEELTLYVIDQQKQINEQAKKIELLTKQIKKR